MSNTASFISPYDLGNLLAPVSGNTRAAKFQIVLAAGSANINIASIQQQMGVYFQPQSLWIDNSQNNVPVVISEQYFGWSFNVNAGVSTWFNFPSISNPVFSISCAGSATVTISFFDFPALPLNMINNSTASGTPVTVTNNPLPVSVSALNLNSASVYTDASVNSTGASQTLVTANSTRKYLLIAAPSSSAIWVNFAGGIAGANLTGCFQIPPTGFYESAINVPSNAITVYCAVPSLIIPCVTG